MYTFNDFLNTLDESKADKTKWSPAFGKAKSILAKADVELIAFYKKGKNYVIETKEDKTKASFVLDKNMIFVNMPDVKLKPQEIDNYIKMITNVKKAAFELDKLIATLDPKSIISI